MAEGDLPNSEQSENLPEQNDSLGSSSEPVPESEATPPSGGRQALRDIRRQLTDEELSQSGAQKMLLEMLEEVEREREKLKIYMTNFYEAEKRAAILTEKLKTERSIEVFFGTGVGLGGAILGLSPFLWEEGLVYGLACMALGLGLIIGSTIGRAIKR